MTDETYIFFRLHSPEAYTEAQAFSDETRGFPDEHTFQSMPNWDDLATGTDGKHYLFIDRWRLRPEDNNLISSMVTDGYADLILMQDYEQAFAEDVNTRLDSDNA